MLENLELLPADPLFRLLGEYKADARTKKVNLGIGLYSDDQGQPFVFPTIKEAFKEVDTNDFNYQPIGGNREYLQLTGKLLLGDLFDESQLAMQATSGGTQACRLFADLICVEQKGRELLVGMPTWGNHLAIFGELTIRKFEHKAEGYKKVLEEAPEGSVLLLHGAKTHNPTGLNLTLEELQNLIAIIKDRDHFVFVDMAYLGMGEGMEQDREYVKLLFRELDNVACAVSYSKNASLYEHRTGALCVKTKQPKAVESQLQRIIRTSISMAPGIGQEIMINVLKNKKTAWLAGLETVRQTIEARKMALVEMLPAEFDYLKNCRGMFGLMPFTEAQIERLKAEFAIFMPSNGRINFGGIEVADIDYLVESMNTVTNEK